MTSIRLDDQHVGARQGRRVHHQPLLHRHAGVDEDVEHQGLRSREEDRRGHRRRTNEKVIRKYAADNNLDLAIVLAKDCRWLPMVENDTAVAFALDDVLLYGLAATARDPAAYGSSARRSVEPYALHGAQGRSRIQSPARRRHDRATHEVGRLPDPLCEVVPESPIPPEGVVLRMPMSEPLKANLTALSPDRPAQ